MWGKPTTPGAALDPWDPQIVKLTSSVLMFAYIDVSHPVTLQAFDQACGAQIAQLKQEGAAEQFHDVVIPTYGLGSKGVTGTTEQNVWDLICAYDTHRFYTLMSVQKPGSPSNLSLLIGVANQMFAPSRSPLLPPLTQAYVTGFESTSSKTHALPLSRLPTRQEVPADYQFLDEEVIVS
jgi:hypothetical protein